MKKYHMYDKFSKRNKSSISIVLNIFRISVIFTLSLVSVTAISVGLDDITQITPVKCDIQNNVDGPIITLTGNYLGAFEVSSFHIDKGECSVWLTGDLSDIFSHTDSRKPIHAKITVKGSISDSGRYGHLYPIYEKEFKVHQVISVIIIEKRKK